MKKYKYPPRCYMSSFTTMIIRQAMIEIYPDNHERDYAHMRLVSNGATKQIMNKLQNNYRRRRKAS